MIARMSDTCYKRTFASGCVNQRTQVTRRLGRRIEWDPEKEVIGGDDEAAGFIRREPRKEFEIEA